MLFNFDDERSFVREYERKLQIYQGSLEHFEALVRISIELGMTSEERELLTGFHSYVRNKVGITGLPEMPDATLGDFVGTGETFPDIEVPGVPKEASLTTLEREHFPEGMVGTKVYLCMTRAGLSSYEKVLERIEKLGEERFIGKIRQFNEGGMQLLNAALLAHGFVESEESVKGLSPWAVTLLNHNLFGENGVTDKFCEVLIRKWGPKWSSKAFRGKLTVGDVVLQGNDGTLLKSLFNAWERFTELAEQLPEAGYKIPEGLNFKPQILTMVSRYRKDKLGREYTPRETAQAIANVIKAWLDDFDNEMENIFRDINREPLTEEELKPKPLEATK